ncbi:MAG: methionyl-tRNA formyltransferase [Flavobacteriales bacterium AspAUS03]
MIDYPRIVFMGTTDFAVVSLKKLLTHRYTVVGVVTTPDNLTGRGQKITESPIKKFASAQGLPLLQPKNLKAPDFLTALSTWQADIQIIVAFRMLPKQVWTLPPLGTFNLHASLLPEYRGAAPIHWAVINGETETGLTTFLLDEQIDTGKILLQKKTAIDAQETAGALQDRLAEMGADLVIETIECFTQNTIQPIPQPSKTLLKPAPKISREDCRINWKAHLNAIFNKIRGLSPNPTAWALLSSTSGEPIPFKIYRTESIKQKHRDPIGKLLITSSEMKVAVEGGYLSITEIQIAGKRRMCIRKFINGLKEKSLLKIY